MRWTGMVFQEGRTCPESLDQKFNVLQKCMNQVKWRGENWKGFDTEDVIREMKRRLFTYTHYIYNIT